MESMVILRSEPKYAQCSSSIFLHFVLVIVAQQATNGKLATFDPDFCSLAHGLKCHETAISTAHEAVRIVRLLDGPRIRFQFPGL